MFFLVIIEILSVITIKRFMNSLVTKYQLTIKSKFIAKFYLDSTFI